MTVTSFNSLLFLCIFYTFRVSICLLRIKQSEDSYLLFNMRFSTAFVALSALLVTVVAQDLSGLPTCAVCYFPS